MQADSYKPAIEMTSRSISKALFLFPTDQMGGAERVTRMLAEVALASERYDQVTCFILSRQPQGTLDSLANNPRVRVIYTRFSKEFLGIPILLRLFISERFDFVFSSHTHLNAFASLARRLRILRTRRLVSRESTLIFERDLGWRGILIRSLYRFYGSQDLIVCQTHRMATSLKKHTHGRFEHITTMLQNPIDLAAIARAKELNTTQLGHIPKEACKIVWCGRLSPVKSPLRAIETLKALHSAGKTDAHLVMIGDGLMREQIESHAKKIGVEEYITITGHHPAPAALMQYCEIGLMTSDVEGFPNVILEMLAAGVLFVVTTDCAGGLKEIPSVKISKLPTPESLAQEILNKDIFTHTSEKTATYLSNLSPESFFIRII